MERRPGGIHARVLFPAVVGMFLLQPILATFFATRSDILLAPLAVTLVVGLWSLDPGRVWLSVGIGAALAAFGTMALELAAPRPALLFVGTVWIAVLALLCVVFGVRWLFGLRRITAETLLMSMSLYLLIGVVFAALALGLYALDPSSFHGVSPGGQSAETAELVYYSIETLSGVAYGDILPVSPLARLYSNLEGVIGNMYVAVLVAMLVTGYAADRTGTGDTRD